MTESAADVTRVAFGGFRSTPDNREAEDEPPEPKGLARIEVRRGIIMEVLGHAGIDVTMNTYAHVLPVLRQEAADAIYELFGA